MLFIKPRKLLIEVIQLERFMYLLYTFIILINTNYLLHIQHGVILNKI